MFKFFGKLAVICNLCFLAVLAWRFWQQQQPIQATNEALRLQPLESTIAILGYGAIFINLIFHVFLLLRWLLKTKPLANKWVMLFNGLLLLIQFYFFFL